MGEAGHAGSVGGFAGEINDEYTGTVFPCLYNSFMRPTRKPASEAPLILPKVPRSGMTPALRQQALAEMRRWLEQERQVLKDRFLTDNDAEAYLVGHAGRMDTLLTALYDLSQEGRIPRVALAAVGGYGREELFPYSDIDLLFLYDDGHEDEAAKMSEFILYFLWDLGLTVGQSHRSIEEALSDARADMTIRTNLLDARFIAGHKALFNQFRLRFKYKVVDGTELEFVDAKLTERDARHQRFGDSRYVLEPNVKEGKGGLRDLHILWWIARYLYSVKALKDLVRARRLTEEEYAAFDQARQFLWRVRVHLHLQAGRAEDRLTFDKQHALAVAMGFKHPSITYAISRFMRRYFVAVRTVGSLTRIFCSVLEEEKKRKPRQSLAWLWNMPSLLGAFRLDGERLNVRNSYAFEYHPALMIELFKTAQAHGLDIHPHTLQSVARNLKLIDDTLRHDAEANQLFLDILLSEHGPEATLRRMSEAGVLGRFIPDFGRVVGQTQFNMYHVYTVDEHTLVALGILHAVEKGLLKEELPLASDVIHRVKMRRVLYLALLCHDIAKGRGGDHSVLGEKIAARLAARFGFSQDEIDTAAWLVRNHLLFSNTAFKRDLEDPKTVQDFVAAVRSPERLKLLLALTVADIRAVGPGVWNGWKASILRDLYRRAEQAMGTGQTVLRQQETGRFKSELQAQLPGWAETEIDTYLEQCTPAFLASCDAVRHAIVARLVRQAERTTRPLLTDIRQDYKRSITDIILCTFDEHGLFSKIAGAMSLAGVNIVSAKVFTLKNGMAVDMFQVQDAAGQAFDRPDRLAKMSVYIEQALSGVLDLAAAVASKTGDFVSPSLHALPVPGQVFIDNDASNISSVIELTGHDRPGFLHDVTQAMGGLGLSIVTAHISTYGAQAVDVFYVKDVFGMKMTHDAKLRQVRDELLKAIKG